MYIRVTSTPKSPRKSVKVVESIREGLKVKQVMIHHVGVAATEDEIAKLKKMGLEFIAQEQLRREESTGQRSLFDQESPEQRLKTIQEHNTKKKRKKTSHSPGRHCRF